MRTAIELKQPTAIAPRRFVANREARGGPLRERMPATDPVYPILDGILRLIPASRWMFGRSNADGMLSVNTCFSSRTDDDVCASLASELTRQRETFAAGPLVSGMLGALGDCSYGVTVVCADRRATHGILTLSRTAALGPFTETEMSMLVYAGDALFEQLSASRFAMPGRESSMPIRNSDTFENADGSYFVLDRDYNIVLSWIAGGQDGACGSNRQVSNEARLPRVIADAVRELTRTWAADAVRESGVARPVPFLVVRTHPLSGAAGFFIGVRIERFHPRNSLAGATARFRISPREAQVLALLLDGHSLEQIAKALCIATSTAQDHVKRMLEKTDSSNRNELIARIFGWEPQPRANLA